MEEVGGAGKPPAPQESGEARQIGSWSAERYDLDFEVSPGETGHAVLWMGTDAGYERKEWSFQPPVCRSAC